jgi:16S rRNA (guanine527-N7)-methyltransferase
VESHLAHAWPLVAVLPTTGVAVDLGSGGGVPGLILAAAGTGLRWHLVESQQRRAQWLTEAVRRLGLSGSVVVEHERAEAVGRGALRGQAALVTARSFGPPAVAAECGAPLLSLGGRMFVAEPPVPDPARWPADGLAELGLATADGAVTGWAALASVAACPERYPRRIGIPSKRPLFGST